MVVVYVEMIVVMMGSSALVLRVLGPTFRMDNVVVSGSGSLDGAVAGS